MRAIINLTENTSKYDCVELEIEENGAIKKKAVLLEDFIRIAQKYFKIKKLENPIPVILPKEVIAFAGNNDDFTLWALFQEKTWYLTYMGKAIMVELPNLLVKIKNNGLAYIYVEKNGFVYDFNFPNMFRGGDICYGSFPTRGITVDQALNYFYEIMSIPLTHSMPSSVKKKNGKYVYPKIAKNDKGTEITEFINNREQKRPYI